MTEKEEYANAGITPKKKQRLKLIESTAVEEDEQPVRDLLPVNSTKKCKSSYIQKLRDNRLKKKVE